VLFTITTTRAPATDLGYLLHKHPDRPQSFEVASGTAHVFYPEAAPERCTAALLLDIDPIALVRGHKNGELTQYVNDRPYAAASMLAVAIKEAFRTALAGRCDARPDLAAEPIPLAIEVTALRCRGGPELTHRVFAPLGWTVDTRTQPFTPREWGDSPYLGLRLTGQARLADALNHLYVLLPVLDDAKHYWVSTEEVDKLIRAGGGWLAGLDAAVLMEVIEHLDPERIPALERVVFGHAAPATVIVTTPNAEYNPHFATLPPAAFRHGDHRFEWTRAQFRGWANQTAIAYGYRARFLPVGPEDPRDGPPTQLAVFTRGAA